MINKPAAEINNRRISTSTRRLLTYLPIFVTMGVPGVVHSATTFNGGDLDLAVNWSSGLPTVETGAVAVDGVFNTTVANRIWNVDQTGGAITASTTNPVDFNGGSWGMTGGSWSVGQLNFTGFTLTIGNNSSVTTSNRFQLAGSSIIVEAGGMYNGNGSKDAQNTADATSSITTNGGSISGLNSTGPFAGTMNLNGGSISFNRMRDGLSGTGQLNVGASGTFTVGAFGNIGTGIIDWAAGSGASVTIGQTNWAETWWDADTLRYNGNGKSDLGGKTWAEVTTVGGLGGSASFDFTGNTLTVIPEPSTFALLVGTLGLPLVMRRRRQS